MDLHHVTSPDGTRIGVHRIGSGPPLVVLHGGAADSTRWNPVAPALAERFSLHLVDRRGRGASTEESDAPYSLRSEALDLVAVLESIGEPAGVLGHSYGGLVALETLPLTDRISAAVLYEPAFDTPGHVMAPAEIIDRYSQLMAGGDRVGALDLFFREIVGVDPVPMHAHPSWPARVAAAHTLDREARIGLGYACDPEHLAEVAVPVRILAGTTSPAPFGAAARAAHAALPDSELFELDGYGHTMMDVDPETFVRLVSDFLLAATRR